MHTHTHTQYVQYTHTHTHTKKGEKRRASHLPILYPPVVMMFVWVMQWGGGGGGLRPHFLATCTIRNHHKLAYNLIMINHFINKTAFRSFTVPSRRHTYLLNHLRIYCHSTSGINSIPSQTIIYAEDATLILLAYSHRIFRHHLINRASILPVR